MVAVAFRACLLAILMAAPGCSEIAGVDFDRVRPRPMGGDAGRDATAGRDASGDGDAGSELDAGADAAPPECDPGGPPEGGVFVSADDGSDEGGDGSAALPFATIGPAITAANALGATVVLLAEGTYNESVTIPDTPNGLTIEGGWLATGADWTRDCEDGVVGRTILAGSASVAVTAQGTRHTSGLRLLTVRTPARGSSPADAAGESLVGVLVAGDGSVFSLTDVVVVAGRGGDGGLASPGAVGAPALAPGACVPAQCAAGAAGMAAAAPGLPAATGGIFTQAGWVPADGEPGLAGGLGENGSPQAQGPDSRSDCSPGCDCNGSSCDAQADVTLRGGDGQCGCGGGGGGPGSPGRGAGASVALMVWGDGATVALVRGVLQAGDGGEGSAGGAGGEGAPGSEGRAGGPRECWGGCCTGGGACNAGGSCYSCDKHVLAGGSAGGVGGTGGPGSQGGAGAGGSSYAIVRISGASTIVDGTVVQHGDGGAGAGEAPSGDAGDVLDVD